MDKRKTLQIRCLQSSVAERGGFEPPVPFWGTPAFQASSFSHSVTSPICFCLQSLANASTVFHFAATRSPLQFVFVFSRSPMRAPCFILQPLGHLSNLLLSSVARQCEHRVSFYSHSVTSPICFCLQSLANASTVFQFGSHSVTSPIMFVSSVARQCEHRVSFAATQLYLQYKYCSFIVG